MESLQCHDVFFFAQNLFFSLGLPLSTQLYEWEPANLMLERG